MRLLRAVVAIASLAVAGLLVPEMADAQHDLMTLPLQDPAYVQLGGLERQGCASARVSAFRPYQMRQIRAALAKAAREPRCAGGLLIALQARFPERQPAMVIDTTLAPDLAVAAARAASLRPSLYGEGRVTVRATALGRGEFRPLWKDVRPVSEGTAPVVGEARARVIWEAHENVVAVAEGLAVTSRRNNPRLRSLSLRDTEAAVEYEEAYFAGRAGPLTASFGRAAEGWFGDENESLVQSTHAPALDRLSLQLTTRLVEGRAMTAMMRDVVLLESIDNLPPGTDAQRYHRWLAAHALAWRPWRSVEFAAGETVLMSHGSRTLDLRYGNPLMFYLVTEKDDLRVGTEQRNNRTAFAAFRWWRGGTTLTGELLVDDFQIDADDRADTPDKLGWRVAATRAVPVSLPASVGVEYRRVDTHTYLRQYYSEVLHHFDQPLGSELGPDADHLRGLAELWLTPELRLSGEAGSWRRGAFRLNQRPGFFISDYGKHPYPLTTPERPFVQRALLASLSIERLSPRLPLSLRVESARMADTNNQLTPAATYMRAQVTGSYVFSFP